METEVAFPYQPLRENEIRLVKILPALNMSDDIFCELETAMLCAGTDDPNFSHERGCNFCEADTPNLFYHCSTCDDGDFDICPACVLNGLTCRCEYPELIKRSSYFALSYTWGDTTVKLPIELDGRLFGVTVNLESALRYLRMEEEVRIIWIDAICINQSDIPEKNVQVRQIGRVYEQSKVTFVWLGEESEDSDAALEFLDELEKQETMKEKVAYMLPEMLAEPHINTGYGALFRLFRRPWWTRVWVLQELMLSKTVVLKVGKQWEYWGKLAQFHDMLTIAQNAFLPELSWPEIGTEAYHSYVLPMNQLRTKFVKTGSIDIQAAIGLTRAYDCQDPRDKIFGLLGMLAPAFEWSGPMYELSTMKVYQAFVKQVILRFRRLEILEYAGLPGYPSWSLDLSLGPRISPFFVPAAELFNAGAYEASVDSLESGCILSVKGLRVDTVSRITRTSTSNGELLMPAMRELVSSLEGDSYISEETTAEAFQRTTLGDIWEDENLTFLRINIQALTTIVSAFDFWSFDELIKLGDITLAEKYPDKVSQPNDLVLGMTRTRLSVQCCNKAFFTTSAGYMGLAPLKAEPDDVICVLFGSQFPFVLRPVADHFDHFQLIGACYLHGIMDGEAVREMEAETIANRFQSYVNAIFPPASKQNRSITFPMIYIGSFLAPTCNSPLATTAVLLSDGTFPPLPTRFQIHLLTLPEIRYRGQQYQRITIPVVFLN